MKVLLDSCVWGGARKELAANGHDVVWVGDWPKDPGDDAVMARAFSEGRVLVTLDKDFGELAIALGRSHCGIIRLVNLSARQHAAVCHRVLSTHEADLCAGAIITAEAQRLRVRVE